MAYIGRGIDNISQIEVLDLITFTDSAGPYNILKGAVAFIPSTVNSLLIEVDGIIQAPASYTVDGSTITFGVSMASTSTMNSMIHFGTGLITTPADGSVTAAKIASDAVTTAKILDNNVTVAKLPTTLDISGNTVTLPASVSGLGTGITNAQLAGSIDVTSKITGVVPTANLGSGSASSSTYLAGDQTYKTITAYNDDALQNDIATLALHQATNANAAKYNLVNTNVDQYEDSTGVASFTDCARDATGEYIATIYEDSAAFTNDSDTVLLLHMDGANDGTTFTDSSSNAHVMTATGNCVTKTAVKKFGTASGYFDATSNTWLRPASSSDFTLGSGDWTIEAWVNPSVSPPVGEVYNTETSSSLTKIVIVAGTDYDVWGSYTGSGWINPELYGKDVATGLDSPTTGNWRHICLTRNGSTFRGYDNGVENFNSAASGTFGTSLTPSIGGSAGWGGWNGYIDELRLSSVCRYPDGTTFSPNSTSVANATGNYVSTATTANASVSKVGIVITYKNQSGTNTLNTDIVAQVSADGGSNYSTVTLTAAGTFSTGVLQAVANDVSVTAGTSIQYKISFANQASGSKVARIYGASLIY